MATLKMTSPWRDPRTGIWNLRRRVPARYKVVAGRSETIKISTGTADPREARRRWPGILEQWDAKVVEWERLLNVVALTPLTADGIAAQWAAWVAEDLGRVDMGEADAALFADGPEGKLIEAMMGTRGPSRSVREGRRLEVHAEEALRVSGVSVTEDSKAMLMAALRPVVAAAYRQASLRDSGIRDAVGSQWNPLEAARSQLPAATATQGRTKAAPTVSLDTLMTGWKAVAPVKANTVEGARYAMEHLASHLGHRDAAKITRGDLVAWRDASKEAGLSNATWNNRLSLVGQVLAWGASSGHLKANPVDSTLRLKKGRPAQRLPYNDAEAARILKAARSEARASIRWAPWVMAFSGMRVAEVLQLTARDVREQDGVWIMAVNEDDATKSVKSGERRHVPIHPALIAEGFLEHAKTIQDDDPLFPDKRLDKFGTRGGRSWQVVGRWVRDTVGIKDPLKAPNHSWRHRVEDELRAADVPEADRDAIIGHARKTVGRSYGVRGENLRRLRDGLARIPVPPGLSPEVAS